MKRFALLFVIIFTASPALSFNIVKCLGERSKAECRRLMMIEDGQSVPLTSGDEAEASSGKFSVTISGENWLRNGWGGDPDKAKDLGIIKDSGVGRLDIEEAQVLEADVESTITEDMKTLYEGLKKGFRKGKIDIAANSQMELLPLTIAGGSGTLGRFCYEFSAKEQKGKTVCVYEGIVRNDNGGAYKMIGTIGDYDDLRQELEGIITSFKFKVPNAEIAPQ